MFDVLYSGVRSKPIKLSTVPPDKTIIWLTLRTAPQVEHRLRNGDWYTEFDMGGGRPTDFTFNSLQAFWPALQTIAAVDDPVRKTHLLRCHFILKLITFIKTGSGQA